MNQQIKISKGKKNEQKGKYKNKHCSPMSNTAWFDLSHNCDTFEKHAICLNPKS